MKEKTETTKKKRIDLRFGGWYTQIPNALTITALIMGLAAVGAAIEGHLEMAALLILAAAAFDWLDGAVARLLNATSELGAELDSFSDFLGFGVAPAILLYTWILREAGDIGMIAVAVFIVSSALRLARFNVARYESKPDWMKGYFFGVPTPAGALVVLLPLYIAFSHPELFVPEHIVAPMVIAWTFISALLMISVIPTFSTKKLRLSRKMVTLLLFIVGGIAVVAMSAPWLTLSGLIILYLVTLPISVLAYRSLKSASLEEEEGEDLDSKRF